jgi:hypothetical protein
MFRARSLVLAAAAVTFATAPGVAAEPAAAELSAADLLPTTTALYAEISQPAGLIDLALDHPLHERVRGIDDYQKALESPQYQQFLLAVKVFEGAVDMRWRPAAKLLTEGGLYFSADLQSKGMAVLVKSGTAPNSLLSATPPSRSPGPKREIAAATIRSHRANTAASLRMAWARRGWRSSATGCCSPTRATWERRFSTAFSIRPRPAQAKHLRSPAARGSRKRGNRSPHRPWRGRTPMWLLCGKRAWPRISLLVPATTRWPRFWWGESSGWRAPPHMPRWRWKPTRSGWRWRRRSRSIPRRSASRASITSEPRGKGAAPGPANVEHAVFQLAAYRDLAEFWAAAPELFNENITAKFAEVDGNLTTLFAGRDFGDEVLGSLEPGIQIVVARQKLPHAELPTPDVKLPAFAAVFRLKEKANVRRNLKVSFQSLMGFLNIVGAMNGQPPLEQSSEKQGDVEIVSGAYLPPANSEEARGLINYNFSPTAVFAGERLIVSSTRSLAEELAAQNDGEPQAAGFNTQARLDSGVLRMILNDNREQLIAQNMLEKGHSRAQAEREIGALLELLTWLRDATIRLARDERSLRLEWSVAFAAHEKN